MSGGIAGSGHAALPPDWRFQRAAIAGARARGRRRQGHSRVASDDEDTTTSAVEAVDGPWRWLPASGCPGRLPLHTRPGLSGQDEHDSACARGTRVGPWRRRLRLRRVVPLGRGHHPRRSGLRRRRAHHARPRGRHSDRAGRFGRGARERRRGRRVRLRSRGCRCRADRAGRRQRRIPAPLAGARRARLPRLRGALRRGVYVPLAREAFAAALKDAGLAESDIDHAVVAALNGRATRRGRPWTRGGRRCPQSRTRWVDWQSRPGALRRGPVRRVGAGRAGRGHRRALAGGRGRRLRAAHHARPGRGTAGPDRGRRAHRGRADRRRARRPHLCQLPHLAFPSRAASRRGGPDPERPARLLMVHRSEEWKYAFAASPTPGLRLPPMPPTCACFSCRAIDQMQPERLADVPGTVATFTIDHLAYSMSPGRSSASSSTSTGVAGSAAS